MNVAPVTSAEKHAAAIDRRRCNRRVAFVKTTYVYEVLSLEEYTDEEISQTWLTPQDEKRIQKDVLRTIACMRKGIDNKAQITSTRGLEHMESTQRMQRRILEKQRLVDAVLSEQFNQFRRGIYSFNRNTAAISSALSRKTRDRAILSAAHDAFVVNERNDF